MSAATATKKRKSSKQTPSPESVPAEPRTAAEIAAELAEAKGKLSGMYSYQSGYEELTAMVEQLAAELDAVEAKTTPTATIGLPKATDHEVEIEFIVVAGNHREIAHEADTIRLSRSLADIGLQQRIAVRDLGDGNFELIFGSRRLAAAKLVGWHAIDAKVYPTETTAEQVELLRLIENMQRAELSPAERALAVARLIDSLSMKTATDETLLRIDAAGGLDDYVGQLLGRSAAWVRDHSYVNRLGGEARRLLGSGRITLGHARELAKLANPADSDKLAVEVGLNDQLTGGKDVPYTARRVQEMLHSLRGMPWRLDVVFGKFGRACETCPHNSKADPSLFEHDAAETRDALLAKAGTCLDSACFEDKKVEAEKLVQVGLKKAVKAEVDATATALSDRGLIPDAIRPESFVRQVKKAVDGGGTTGKSSRVSGSSSAVTKVDHVHEAKRKYEDDRREWGNALAKKLLNTINKTPAAKAVYVLLDEYQVFENLQRDPWQSYSYGNDDPEKDFITGNARVDKLAAQSRTSTLLGYLQKPTLSAIEAIVKDEKIDDSYTLGRLNDASLLELAELLGVEADPAPDRDAMIVKATAKA